MRLWVGRVLTVNFRKGAAGGRSWDAPIRVVVVFSKVLELHAQPATCHGIVGVAAELYQFTILNMIQEHAGIRTILGASASDDTGFAQCADIAASHKANCKLN
jgi:hypothetical protein